MTLLHEIAYAQQALKDLAEYVESGEVCSTRTEQAVGCHLEAAITYIGFAMTDAVFDSEPSFHFDDGDLCDG